MIGPAIIHQVRATYAVLASYGVILPVLFKSLCALFLIAIRPLVPGWPLPLIGIRKGSASNPEFTCLRMSRIRGYGGMVEANVIPRVNGDHHP